MPRNYSSPITIPVRVSAVATTSTNSGNLKNTANAIPLCDACTLILDVTALSATTSQAGVISLDVYIDSSPDGGTSWYPSMHFATVSTSTGISKHECRLVGIGPSEVADSRFLGSTIVATTSTSNTVLAADHRLRWVPLGSGASATFAVWAICSNNGFYGN